MDDTQRNAVMADAITSKNTSEREIALLQAEAQRIGTILMEVGSRLVREPENVIFDNVPAGREYAVGQPSFKIEDINGTRLAELTNDLRKHMDNRERRKSQIERF